MQGIGQFKDLIIFESKKLLCKKSVGILFALTMLLTLFRYVNFADNGGELLSGVQYFFELADTTILIVFLLTNICIAPIFSDEYSTRVDKLILSSKNGKNKLIGAKILTGILIAIGVFLVFFSVAYVLTFAMCGFETTTLEEWSFFGIYNICALSGTLFSSIICMLFSVKMKSSYSAVVVALLFTIISRILHFPESAYIVRGITQLLPMQMANLSSVLSTFTYSIAGIPLSTYQVIPMIAVSGSIIMIVCMYQMFKHHQSY